MGELVDAITQGRALCPEVFVGRLLATEAQPEQWHRSCEDVAAQRLVVDRPEGRRAGAAEGDAGRGGLQMNDVPILGNPLRWLGGMSKRHSRGGERHSVEH